MFRPNAVSFNSPLIIAPCLLLLAHSSLFGEPDWNQWRGPSRNGQSADTGLLKRWPAEGPRLLWKAAGLGAGYSSIAKSNGRIFTLGAKDDHERLIALDAESGKQLWALPVGNGDHSNSTPTIDGDRVYAIGLQGDLVCANSSTGREIWRRNFARDFQGKMMSGWGYSESPLVDGDSLLCTPGGRDAMIVSLDKLSGNERWRASFPDLRPRGNDGAGYSSIVVSRGAGVKQYVQLTGRGLVSVRAADGQFLWGYNAIANDTANIPTPIVSGDLVFASSGYGAGAVLLKLVADGDGVKAQQVYFLDGKTFQNHHGGMIQVGDYIYAGHRHNSGFPICIELRTGKVAWGGDQRGPGQGSAALAYADGHFIFRYQNGLVALIEATPTEYRLKGTFTPVYQEGESWAHPVVTDGRLYLREQDVLMCYDLRAT
jgi:outer membrane protein assembly factor BamB